MLWELLAERAAALLPVADAVATNARQSGLLRDACGQLSIVAQEDLLIIAEQVRCAIVSLNAVTGRSGTEEVLDSIFSRFCIGK